MTLLYVGYPVMDYQVEVESAIKPTKSGKAAGYDDIVSQLLKTDLDERTKHLTNLFNNVKDEGIAARRWNKRLIGVIQEG